ncbi:putative acylneuraminate cytidylyltransferase [Prochlorococcus marinus str. MIT 9312]|uniref:Putative acylneuraminate cytidylyltransferase n=1 Tax=Prochlorococcus marinus (strain MIT 9312) TaxID=74546 RepID=Q319N6_PROM9|nr:acylneuraminate cytidylyltransferase family protein [Prochlorococcus marinus]ABB50409.1 putative acylneuraminate cytidylyltransferase [Prochlorococcus marinus str. MIT 9312]KGF99793.1 N-Acetylneuraminate cytidylyltransferase [Prochlorococcus marinus str. MIT 9311]
MKFVAILLARGGSKGIPKKNLLKINKIPLISFTIRQCFSAGIEEIYTSSDDDEILSVARDEGSKLIKRPLDIAHDCSTSESAWLHAIDNIDNLDDSNDWIFAPQLTSPIRETFDIKNGLEIASSNKYDSIFSAVELNDFLIWKNENNKLEPINYDFQKRLRRQDIKVNNYLENGSFYLFKPCGIKKFNNRLYGRIGICKMDKLKMFQIDHYSDIFIVEKILQKLNIK